MLIQNRVGSETPVCPPYGIQWTRFRLFSIRHHQRIGGDFDKPAGCKGGFDAGQIRAQQLFQICVANVAGGDQ